MSPDYLNELADFADPSQLWRLSGIDYMNLPPEQRKQVDAGVALRRYASHMRELKRALESGNCLLITPLSQGSSTRSQVDTPPDHQRLKDVRKGS